MAHNNYGRLRYIIRWITENNRLLNRTKSLYWSNRYFHIYTPERSVTIVTTNHCSMIFVLCVKCVYILHFVTMIFVLCVKCVYILHLVTMIFVLCVKCVYILHFVTMIKVHCLRNIYLIPFNLDIYVLLFKYSLNFLN